MPRGYSQELINSLQSKVVLTDGQELAQLCMEANLPAIHVAEVLFVSRMTIHSWFRGSPIRQRNMERVVAFKHVIQKDLHDGILPAKSLTEAKEYLSSFLPREDDS
jgi:hypothetical protein